MQRPSKGRIQLPDQPKIFDLLSMRNMNARDSDKLSLAIKKNVQELHLIYFVWTIAGIDDVSAALLVSLQYENILQK